MTVKIKPEQVINRAQKILREQKEKQNEQLRLEGKIKIREEEIRKIMRELKEEYNINDQKELGERIETLIENLERMINDAKEN